MQGIEHFGKIGTGERPAAENFLGALIDVDNYDAGVGAGRLEARPQKKARVERGIFQACKQVGGGRVSFSYQHIVVKEKTQKGYDQADEQRFALAPQRAEYGAEQASRCVWFAVGHRMRSLSGSAGR